MNPNVDYIGMIEKAEAHRFFNPNLEKQFGALRGLERSVVELDNLQRKLYSKIDLDVEIEKDVNDAAYKSLMFKLSEARKLTPWYDFKKLFVINKAIFLLNRHKKVAQYIKSVNQQKILGKGYRV